MFRITEDPSSGSLCSAWLNITAMVLSCPLTWTRSVLWQHILCVCVCSSLYRKALTIFVYCTSVKSSTVNHFHKTLRPYVERILMIWASFYYRRYLRFER